MSVWQLKTSADPSWKAREKLEKVWKYGEIKISKRVPSEKQNHYYTIFETVANKKKRIRFPLNMFSNFSGECVVFIKYFKSSKEKKWTFLNLKGNFKLDI